MVKCSLKMLLKYFQIRTLFVVRVRLTVWQDTRTRANNISSSNCCFLGWEIDCQFFNQSRPNNLFCTRSRGSLFLSDLIFFPWALMARCWIMFCEIVRGIIIFCLIVFTPHFLQPAESHTIDIFWTEKLRKTDIPRTRLGPLLFL